MRFVVAVDGSEQALRGARLVASLPLSAADDVLLASIVERPMLIGAWGYVHTPATAELYAQAWDQAQRDAQHAVASGAAALADIECPVRQVVREGHPVSELISLIKETDPDVVVVGPHGQGRLESILLGSVSQSILHAMPTAVLVVREPVRAPHRIVLATDGSPQSLAATRLLARFPLPDDAQIFVLTVVDVRRLRAVQKNGADLADLVGMVQRGASELIHRSVDVLEAAGRAAKPVIKHGDPKREILATAAELKADLIVTGARGIGGFRGMILGSVSRAVSKASPCSTLVVAANAGGGEEGRTDG